MAIYISKDVLFHESRFPFLDLFPASTSTSSSPHSVMSWFPSAASPSLPLIHHVPPLQHVSPCVSPASTSIDRQSPSTPAHSLVAATPNPTMPSPLSLPSQPNLSQFNSPSPNFTFPNLVKASTISPSSLPVFVPSNSFGYNYGSTYSHVTIPPVLHPLNVHPRQTRAKSGIIQPRLHPKLFLTHMEPTSVKQALATPHWLQAM